MTKFLKTLSFKPLRRRLYELYYKSDQDSIDFDPEFSSTHPALVPLKLRMRNLNNHLTRIMVK